MDAPILFYFYPQHWISGGRSTSQCDEVFGEVAREGRGAVYICPVSIATVGLGLEFPTTVF